MRKKIKNIKETHEYLTNELTQNSYEISEIRSFDHQQSEEYFIIKKNNIEIAIHLEDYRYYRHEKNNIEKNIKREDLNRFVKYFDMKRKLTSQGIIIVINDSLSQLKNEIVNLYMFLKEKDLKEPFLKYQ